jgi:DNA repair exonuclease SbcCD nuclease subunit
MRLAFVSDTHLGFARGSVREGDAFFQLKQALEGIASQAPDAIIHPGDFFDHKIPQQEVWDEAFQCLRILQEGKQSSAKVTHYARNGSAQPFAFQGIPLIAIAGTHEYRSKDFKNALQVMHTANMLICLHASHAVIEKEMVDANGEKKMERVAVHGMSGIPEKRALEALRMYNPQPLQDHHNLLVLHQSIKEFLPSKDDMTATIGLSDLPSGFDLLVNGHLHWTTLTEWEGKRLLIPGSTVFTQMKRLESEKPKGWHLYDTQTKQLEFHAIPQQRKLYYHKIRFKNAHPQKVLLKCKEIVEKDLQPAHEMLPLYRLKLVGSLAKGYTQADVDVHKHLAHLNEKAIFSIGKKINAEQFHTRLEELRELHQGKQSVGEKGMDLLEKNLAQTPFGERMQVKDLFELLEDKQNVDKAVQLLERGELLQQKKAEDASAEPKESQKESVIIKQMS